ncbi:hypothetical protein [Microlunatus sp. Y2014]|uniref:hypothetical protein n=1 Tax=Microlunatus sp. Y2014 TaxID=3418488 RepID=UPI003DA74A79
MSLYGQESALRKLQDEVAGFRDTSAETQRGKGETGEGEIVVEVVDGQIEELTLGPRALRNRTNDELADLIKEAANLAIQDYASHRTNDKVVGSFEALLDSVDSIAAAAERDFAKTMDGMDRALRQVEQLAAQQQSRQEAHQPGQG